MEGNDKYAMKNGCTPTKFSLKPKLSPVKHFRINGEGPSPKKIKLVNKENVVNNNHSAQNGTTSKKLSIQEQKKRLPIFEKRNKLIELIKKFRTLIIMAETGSGKSTQIPQYIYAARIQGNGKIAITQPRRVAAISLAMRVTQEFGSGLTIGDLVGYCVRFEDVTSKKTKIKYVTDGMLLREAMADKLLMEYSIIILDEAHERTIHTDILFGIVKQAQKIREKRELMPLQVILMSATMDVDHFSKYFDNCEAVYIEGRTYPVNVFHTTRPYDDYQTSCISTFFKIHREAPPDHDVLIFLTGQEEIESCAHQIRLLSRDPQVVGPPIRIFTLYAAQPSSQQMAVFQQLPAGMRKVVISTNIAETSITISGIKYVIDSGMFKARTFHPNTGLELLKVQKISHQQAWQRTGRAGRESEGYCYRVYTKTQFELMKQMTVPEIQRANLNSVVLQLAGLGIHALQFDFLDKPPREALSAAFEQLGVLDAIYNVNSVTLTPLGKEMIKFPLDPRFSKILLTASKYSCLEEALTIVALLCSESVLLSPPGKKEQAETARQKFNSSLGDHLTLLNIYQEFNNIGQSNVRTWCHEHFVNMRNILYVREVRKQLVEICKKCSLTFSSCGTQVNNVRKCLLSGLFMNVAELHRDKQYITLDKRQTALIHPSSTLYGQQPQCIVFTEVVQTSKCYLRALTTIEPEWLNEIAPEYVKSHNIKFSCSSH